MHPRPRLPNVRRGRREGSSGSAVGLGRPGAGRAHPTVAEAAIIGADSRSKGSRTAPRGVERAVVLSIHVSRYHSRFRVASHSTQGPAPAQKLLV